jgi:hypothetical protein
MSPFVEWLFSYAYFDRLDRFYRIVSHEPCNSEITYESTSNKGKYLATRRNIGAMLIFVTITNGLLLHVYV